MLPREYDDGMGTLVGVVLVVLAVGASLAWMSGAVGPSTISGDAGYAQPGASGPVERIFFMLFGAPRDTEKEKNLSWSKRPVLPNRQPNGFMGRGASRRW